MLRRRGSTLPWRQIARFLTASAQAALCRTSSTTRFTIGWNASSPNKVARVPSHLVDLTDPACWYPAARDVQRQVVIHLGPANSGKTYQALEALKQAQDGVYCGPLRLLALEVAEKLNAAGVPCSLITGQERNIVPGAKHVACTVEMASVVKPVQVAVVDEIQMMADPLRGHAFTRALLGLPAQHLHVCGDPAAWPLLQKIISETGDEVQLKEYERLSELKVSPRPLGTLEKVRAGDCVVAFSRREVHMLRHQIEHHAQGGCCIVYGALPPEARSQQAALFNTPRTGFNTLVASDAVGMGLNLNIRRVVFSTMHKFDGRSHRPLTVPETKQIAGRAGRFGSKYAAGLVTTLHKDDLPRLQASVHAPSPWLERACLLPRFEQLALYMSQQPLLSFASALHELSQTARMRQHYFFGDVDVLCELASIIEHLPLSLAERYTFVLAPADPTDAPVAAALLSFATAFSYRRMVSVAMLAPPPLAPVRDDAELAKVEALHRVYSLFIWLSWRFEHAFRGRQQALQQQSVCARLIDEGLHRLAANRTRVQTAAAERLRKAAAVRQADA